MSSDETTAPPSPGPTSGESDHWLVRPATIRWLWIGFAGVLVLLVLADVVLPKHPYFGIDGWFGFYSAFGFLACLAMIVFSKILGILIKRRDSYYDDR